MCLNIVLCKNYDIMETGLGEILTPILTFIVGGGLTAIFTLKFQRKKAAVEVKTDEIKALRDAVDMVYKPLIDTQKDRIQELEAEVKSLREQLKQERKDRQDEISRMNGQILQITSALGMKVVDEVNKNARKRLGKNIDVEPE